MTEAQNKPYHLRYSKIKPETIEAVKFMIQEGYYKMDTGQKIKGIILLNNVLSKFYGLIEPKLIFHTDDDYKYMKGYGYYDTLDNSINLNLRLSLVTYLHEFKHCIQVQKNANNNEEIVRGWSLSVFYQASPKHFINAVQKGLILFVKPEDLVYNEVNKDNEKT